MTEWRDIPGYPGYQASNEGSVRRIRACRNGWRPRELKGYVNKLGYVALGIMIDGKRIAVHAHRLVALAFHGEPPTPEHEVAHGDGDGLNNRPDNLRWATRKENAADRRKHGRDTIGERHGMARLTETDVRRIFALASAHVDQRLIAKCFGIHQAQVHRIYSGKSWKHLGLRTAAAVRLHTQRRAA